MIGRISSTLMLACIVPLTVMGDEQTRSPRRHDPVVIQMPKAQEAWLTQDQAQHILTSVEMLVRQMQEMSRQNRAPRPGATSCNDPAFPGCGTCDLSGVLAALCSIELQLFCICERLSSSSEGLASCCDTVASIQENLASCCDRVVSIQDGLATCCDRVASIQETVGSCTDHSVLLGSQVDKSCIDGLCESVVTLLKTILLELRGNFTGPFPCSVTHS